MFFFFFFFFFYRTLHSAVLLILIMHVDWTPRTAESHFISFFLSVHFFASRSPSANPFLVVERNNSKYFCRMKSGTQIHYTDKTFQTNARWFPIIIQIWKSVPYVRYTRSHFCYYILYGCFVRRNMLRTRLNWRSAYSVKRFTLSMLPSFNTCMRTRVYVCISVCHTYLGVIFGCHIVKNARGEVSKWERATMILLVSRRHDTHPKFPLSSVDRGGRHVLTSQMCIAISSTLRKGINDRSIIRMNMYNVVLLFFFW